MDDTLRTPVLFLIFNRPGTTQLVFEEIRKAKPGRLYIAADGPRRDVSTDVSQCAEAREIIARIDWPCQVQTLLRDENLGCKIAVSSALDWFFAIEDEGIILEDDCLPGPEFFPFCQLLLEKYRDDERVAMISGTNHLQGEFAIPETYLFSQYFNIWGWASWKRMWTKYDRTMTSWERKKEEGAVNSFYRQKYMREHVARMFDLAFNNQIDTWDIQWFFTCLFSGGLAIVPAVNLISNIGEVGTHSAQKSTNNFQPVFPLDVQNIVHPGEVKVNEAFDNMLYEKQIRKMFWERTVVRGRELYHRIIR